MPQRRTGNTHLEAAAGATAGGKAGSGGGGGGGGGGSRDGGDRGGGGGGGGRGGGGRGGGGGGSRGGGSAAIVPRPQNGSRAYPASRGAAMAAGNSNHSHPRALSAEPEPSESGLSRAAAAVGTPAAARVCPSCHMQLMAGGSFTTTTPPTWNPPIETARLYKHSP